MLIGASCVRKHKTLRMKALEPHLLGCEFLPRSTTYQLYASGYVSFLSLIFPIGEIRIITVLVS